MKRRPFLKLSGGVAGGLTLGLAPGALSAPVEIVDRVNGVPYRVLGRTGERVSIVAYPGLALVHDEQPVCTRSVHNAIDQGINYLDVAPAYGNGDCEIKLGNALEGVSRDRYLLACKTKMRDKAGAREELERSLKRLKTDHFDVYQMHHLRTVEEVQQAFGPDGAMETFFEAQKEGKVRFLGFSSHTTKSALEAMKSHSFDTVMFPINFIEHFTFGFGNEVIELANQQGAAVIAIKPMCGGYWPKDVQMTRDWWYRPLEDKDDIAKALRFTLSQPGVTIGVPPGFIDLFDRALESIRTFEPVSEDEIAALKAMAAERLSVFEERQNQFGMASPHEEGLYPCPYATA